MNRHKIFLLSLLQVSSFLSSLMHPCMLDKDANKTRVYFEVVIFRFFSENCTLHATKIKIITVKQTLYFPDTLPVFSAAN